MLQDKLMVPVVHTKLRAASLAQSPKVQTMKMAKKSTDKPDWNVFEQRDTPYTLHTPVLWFVYVYINYVNCSFKTFNEDW